MAISQILSASTSTYSSYDPHRIEVTELGATKKLPGFLALVTSCAVSRFRGVAIGNSSIKRSAGRK